MKNRVLAIAVIAASAVLAGGWALAQSRETTTTDLDFPSCRATDLAGWDRA